MRFSVTAANLFLRQYSVISRSGRAPSLVILILISPLAPARGDGDEIVLTGRIVDLNGVGVAGCTISDRWELDSTGTFHPRGFRVGKSGTLTNDAGAYRLVCLKTRRQVSVLVLDSSRSLGGTLTMTPDSSKDLETIRLGPMVPIDGQFVASDDESRPILGQCTLAVAGGSAVLTWSLNSSSRIHALAPPGNYVLGATFRYHDSWADRIQITPMTKSVALHKIGITIPQLVKMIGRRPPKWHTTSAIVPATAPSQTSFHGKWIVVEFWLHPFLADSEGSLSPVLKSRCSKLIEFAAQNREISGATQVVVIVDIPSDVEPTLHQLLGDMKQTLAKHNYPICVFADSSGLSKQEWGVKDSPTTLVLDPDGKLLDTGTRDPLLFTQEKLDKIKSEQAEEEQ